VVRVDCTASQAVRHHDNLRLAEIHEMEVSTPPVLDSLTAQWLR
jgi:hypothetical protein